MVKILSPAGSYEAVCAAISAGANEVYFGGSSFNARAYAKNFTAGEMAAAIELCHIYGVKVLVTFNTLIGDREMADALAYAKTLYDMKTDALIVQDLGLLEAIHSLLPDFELHASTQMSVHSLDGANEAYGLGCKRVVLARELSKQNIKFITDNSKAETEVFVHGALCYSHSGQCLMSAVIGKRSGNRGRCAGPCRLPYKVGGKHGYFLSLKDFCLADKVCELEKIGVASLKIEGRMKRPEYVGAVTRVYAQAAKGKKIGENDIKKLADIFSRSGFTDCFYESKLGSNNLGRKEDTDTHKYAKLLADERLKYQAILKQNVSAVPAEKDELFARSYISQKLGEKKRFVKTKYYCFYLSAEQVGCENEKIDTVFLPIDEVLKGVKTTAKVGIHFPKILTDDEVDLFQDKLKRAIGLGIKTVCIENIGQIAIAEKYNFDFICGISFNVFNTLSADKLFMLRASGVMASAECSFPQLRDISKYRKIGFFAYGRLELMTSESCLMRNTGICNGTGCKKQSVLCDRKDEKFPVLSQPHFRNTIYNSKVIWLADKKKQIKEFDFDFLVLSFTLETRAQCGDVIDAYTALGEYKPKDYTRGFTDNKVL